jgi:hypothetical protein
MSVGSMATSGPDGRGIGGPRATCASGTVCTNTGQTEMTAAGSAVFDTPSHAGRRAAPVRAGRSGASGLPRCDSPTRLAAVTGERSVVPHESAPVLEMADAGVCATRASVRPIVAGSRGGAGSGQATNPVARVPSVWHTRDRLGLRCAESETYCSRPEPHLSISPS